jgi:hypothetical protein
MSDPSDRADTAALRAEHDALAAQLATRPSVDAARKGLILAFVGFIALGTAGALAWDHWGPVRPGEVRVVVPGRPMFFLVALAVGLAIATWSAVTLRGPARRSRAEAALFRRLQELRGRLGLDA